MKQVFVAIAMLLLSCETHAQSLAQPSVSHDCGGATSCSVSLANPVTIGNSLFTIVRAGTTNVAAMTITDNLANTYTLDASVIQSIDGHSLAIYRSQVAAAGTATVSVSNSTAATMRIIGFAEVTGLMGGAPDGINKAIGSSNVPQPGAVLPTQPNDYILIAASTANNETFTVNGGFHSEQFVSKGAFGDLYQATAVSVAGSMTLSSADQWAAIAVAYKAMSRLPISFQLNFSDGTPVQGNVQLSVVSGTTTTLVASWPINSSWRGGGLSSARQYGNIQLQRRRSHRQAAPGSHGTARRLYRACRPSFDSGNYHAEQNNGCSDDSCFPRAAIDAEKLHALSRSTHNLEALPKAPPSLADPDAHFLAA